MKTYSILAGLLALLIFTSFTPEKKITIFTIGDSTCANKPIEKDNRERGWGQMLEGFFDTRYVQVENHALNGRSSLSFRKEGHWDAILQKIKPGDYVFIQFGHNDSKPDSARHTDPVTTYPDQLSQYIKETRKKGGIPVILTSIVRRNFDTTGVLVETHGGYPDAARKVAMEKKVFLIDLNLSSKKLVQDLGPEDSKALFLWFEKGINLAAPEGRSDNTHLCAKGARAIANLAVKEIAEKIPALSSCIRSYDYVVAKDGSGDFFTVQEAINAVPIMREVRTTIFIRKGIYKEKITVPDNKRNISLIGESETETILTGDDFADRKNAFGERIGTFGSATIYIYGSDFQAENMTFENSAGPVGQAVAVATAGDKAVFRHCRFLGFQDTLYTYGKLSRQYFEDCYIEGTVDFIFGPSTVVFNRCEIFAKRSGGYLTAASTPEGVANGYVFLDCNLTAKEGVTGVYLGRPWRPFAQTVFVNCEMGAHIRPEGWHNWKKADAEKTSFYAEYGSKGMGANADARVKWAKEITAEKVLSYTVELVLAGADGWNPVVTKN